LQNPDVNQTFSNTNQAIVNNFIEHTKRILQQREREKREIEKTQEIIALLLDEDLQIELADEKIITVRKNQIRTDQ
jgi:inner membrane protein involved in colicin E2 resistance